MAVDYVALFGAKDGSRFAILLERRPKWLLLILYLRKYTRLSFKEARRLLNVDYSGLAKAVRYLACINPRDARRPGHAVSPVGDPFIAVEVLSQREKYLVLTEYGRSFAEKVIDYLKYVAVTHGYVDVEERLGVAKLFLFTELKRRLPEVDVEKYERRVISLEELVSKLSVVNPRLIPLIKPEVIDAVPVEIVTPRRTYVLYVVL